MARLPHLAAYAVLATAVASAGCGSQTKHAKPLRGWLSYDSSRRTATIRLVPAYNGALGGFNFNGYAKGEVAVVVPLGWKVTVRCENTGQGGRHSCALVRGPGATRPAIVGASSPDPANGLAAGRTATFSFSTRRRGVYRLASLVPNDERAGMWDVIEIERVRRPSLAVLRRVP